MCLSTNLFIGMVHSSSEQNLVQAENSELLFTVGTLKWTSTTSVPIIQTKWGFSSTLPHASCFDFSNVCLKTKSALNCQKTIKTP